MPRASPAAKRQPGAASPRNQHDNGLVGSARRPTKHQSQRPQRSASPMRASSSAASTASRRRAAPPAAVSAASAVPTASFASPAASLSTAASPESAGRVAVAEREASVESPVMVPPHDSADPGASAGQRRQQALHAQSPDSRLSVDNASSISADSFALRLAPVMDLAVASSAPTPFDDSHRRIDVNASKNANVHRDTGPVSLAMTVLRSCPLYDTIAILIILMQLSPVALSSIYMLFTVLTFVPPVTTSSGISLTDIFEGSPGTPSLTTLVCMDVGFFLVWLFLWGPLQQLILDFAQIVIALTLGGGSGSGGRPSRRQGPANNIIVCTGIVLFSHFGHIPGLQKLTHLGPLFAGDLGSASTVSPTAFPPAPKLFARRDGGVSWLRNIFAIHILTQGIVRYIREWYLQREKRDSLGHNNANDPEAGKGIFAVDVPASASYSVPDTPSSNFVNSSNNSNSYSSGSSSSSTNTVTDTNTNSSSSSSISGGSGSSGNSTSTNTNTNNSYNSNALSSSPGTGASSAGSSSNLLAFSTGANAAGLGTTGNGASEGTVGGSADTPSNTCAVNSTGGFTHAAPAHVSAKKKRKQSALVRLRQPLWAALASTKIVMIKEYELSQAASESAGTEATDVDNLGNAPFYNQPCQIWICYVGHDEFCFSTSVFPDNDHGTANYSPPTSFYFDMTKPFFVRINNATWQPTRITAISDAVVDDVPRQAGMGSSAYATGGTRWTGDVYGLTPLSSYECEFVSTRTGEVLYTTSVRTAEAPSKNADVTTTKPPPPSQLRPHESPAMTIKASIAAQEAKLQDEKTRLKTLRKDNNRRINLVKKEIDRLAVSVLSSGGNDDKLKQKISQNTVQEKQAEDNIKRIESKLREVSVVPEDLVIQHRNKKAEFDKERSAFEGVVAGFKNYKSTITGEIRELEDEQASLQAKRTKIASRISKASSDYERIMDANTQGLDEVERRNQERTAIQSEIAKSQHQYSERIAAMQASNADRVQTINSMHEAMRSFYSSFDSERPYEDRHLAASHLPSQVPPSMNVGTGAWTSHQAPPSGMYAPGYLWSAIPGAPTSGPSPAAPNYSTAPFSQMSQLHAGGQPVMLRTRGRSSSMLSDMSGFTQSSLGDDDAFIPAATGTQGTGAFSSFVVPSAQTSLLTTLRGPPGLGSGRPRRSSGSGSSGSVSGSGSIGSVCDPASPL